MTLNIKNTLVFETINMLSANNKSETDIKKTIFNAKNYNFFIVKNKIIINADPNTDDILQTI